MKKVICFLLLLLSTFAYSQKILDMHYTSIFGKNKSFQFFNQSDFSYKQKGDLFYRTHKLVNMQDSFLVLDNDSVILLRNIKSVKIKGVIISPYFFGAGSLFFLLDTGHGLTFNRSPVVSEGAIMVTAVSFGLGFIIKYFQDKHIRIKKNSVFRIIDMDYRNLQTKSSNH